VKIRTKLNKRVLDVSQSTDHGHEKGELILYDDYGSANQQFILTADGPDFIMKSTQSNKALEVTKGSQDDGAKIIEA
jgi:hypothetical protein